MPGPCVSSMMRLVTTMRRRAEARPSTFSGNVRICAGRRILQRFTQDETLAEDEAFTQDETFAENESFAQDEAFTEDETLAQNETFTENEAFVQDETAARRDLVDEIGGQHERPRRSRF